MQHIVTVFCALAIVFQGCLGANVTLSDNTAAAGGSDIYLADAAAINATLYAQAGRMARGAQPPKLIPDSSRQCSRQDLNTSATTVAAGPPCALVLWSPASGIMLPYVNNGSGLPTINASVVDCWCGTVRQLPGGLMIKLALKYR